MNRKIATKPSSCVICNSEEFTFCFSSTDKFYGGDDLYGVWECIKCKLIITFPIPYDFSLIYPCNYYSYTNNKDSTKEKIYRYLKHPYKIINKSMLLISITLEKLLYNRSIKINRGEKILDIGCGYGEFLLKMKIKGMDAYGVEPGEFNTDFPDKYGLKIHKGTLLDAKFPDNYFNLVRLNHSLEHIDDPQESLNELFRITKRGGIVLVQVPNVDSISQKIFKENWGCWDIPRHLFHYSNKTLKGIVSKSGFIYQKTRHLYSGYTMMLTLENLFNKFRKDKKLLKESNFPDFGLFRLICLTWGIITSLIKKGDVIELVFKKQN